VLGGRGEEKYRKNVCRERLHRSKNFSEFPLFSKYMRKNDVMIWEFLGMPLGSKDGKGGMFNGFYYTIFEIVCHRF
jgi:hypothetical protein